MTRLHNFPIYKQATPSSCGFSSIAMVSSYFHQKEISENEIQYSFLYKKIENFLGFDFCNILNKYLPDQSAKLLTPPQGQIVNIFTKQLRNKVPIPIIYSTPNIYKSNKIGLHYAVVIGMNQNSIVLANPFGYEETLDTVCFLEKMAYKNFNNKPLKIKFGIWLKLVRPNSLFYITSNK